jgi:acyl-CoA thioesterase
MNPEIKKALFHAVETEPFARAMNMTLTHLETGHSVVKMTYRQDQMDNIYQKAHGGALFALIDEAFETASQTHGTIAVALNINVTYITPPAPGARLKAEAREVSRTRKTAAYEIKVTTGDNSLIAICQALAYRTGRPIPFL